MQGQASMTDKSTDYTRLVLEDRKRRRKDFLEEMRQLSKHKRRIKARLQEGRDWPMEAATGERAEIDHDDVMAPLPEEMRATIGDVDERMQKLRKEADTHVSFAEETVQVDPSVLSRRRREREEERKATEAIRGETWTDDLVEARMKDAYQILFRASLGGMGPRAFGNAMPEVVREVSDLVHQAGNKSLRNAIAHRFKSAPTRDEVMRAEEALAWALTYLRDEHPDVAAFVSLGAMWSAWNAKISQKCKAHGITRQTFYRDRREGIKLIVAGLIRDGKAPK